MKVAELIKAEPGTNQYRIWRMVQEGSAFRVSTGRAGCELIPVAVKQMHDWDKVLARKKAEGFIERTGLVTGENRDEYRPIDDPDVRDLFEYLQGVSRKYAKKAYRFTEIHEITAEMVEQAQEILEDLGENRDAPLEWVNRRLIDLFVTVPRRTESLEKELCGPDAPVGKVLAREQAMLDVLASQVYVSGKRQDARQTILESLGVTARPVTEEEKRQIVRHMDPESRKKYVKAFRVCNTSRDREYAAYMEKRGLTRKDVHFLYHGSRSENWFGIIAEGPKLHPDAIVTGNALGNGIYFANLFKKSDGYADGGYWTGQSGSGRRRYVGVFRVPYGNPMHLKDHCVNCSARSIGPHDAVFFHGGGAFIHDEIVVYHENVSMEYLIQVQ